MKKKILSFLIPSRGRLEILTHTIYNIIESFEKNIDDIEIIINLDLDDLESHKILSNQFDVEIKYIISDRLKGYLSLSDFMSQCYKISEGYFFVLYNDDIRIKNNHGLIENLKEVKDIISISSETFTSHIPIIHHKIIEITNGFHSEVVYYDGHYCNVKLALPAENQFDFKIDYDHQNQWTPDIYTEKKEAEKHYGFDATLGHGERYFVDLDSNAIKSFFNNY